MKLRNQQVLAMLLAGAMSISSVMTGMTAFAEEAEKPGAEMSAEAADEDDTETVLFEDEDDETELLPAGVSIEEDSDQDIVEQEVFDEAEAVIIEEADVVESIDTLFNDPSALDEVKAMIASLDLDPTTYKPEDRDRIEEIITAYEALSAEEQEIIDTEALDGGQPYGRVLESAWWGILSLEEVDNSTTLPDGTYDATTTPALSSSYSKGKSTSSRQKPWSVKSVTVADGKATAVITVESTSYSKIWTQGRYFDKTNTSGNSEFADVPIDLNNTFYLAGVSTSMPRPIAFSVTNEIEETEEPEKENLSITNETNMFKAIDAFLYTAEGVTNLVVTLNGTGYHELFKGTYDEAVATGEDSSRWIIGKLNEVQDGKYTFTIPLTDEELAGNAIQIQSLSFSHKEAGDGLWWYPRMMVIDREAKTLVTDDYHETIELALTNNAGMFKVNGADLEVIGGPHSNNYKIDLILKMGSSSFSKVYTGTAKEALNAEEGIVNLAEGNLFTITAEKINGTGTGAVIENPVTWDTEIIMAFYSAKNQVWYERKVTVSRTGKSILINDGVKADYTRVNEAIAAIPEDLDIYMNKGVAAVEEAQAAVVKNLYESQQDDVDAMAEAIENAVAELKTIASVVKALDEQESIGLADKETVEEAQESLAELTDEQRDQISQEIGKPVDKIMDQAVTAVQEAQEQAENALELIKGLKPDAGVQDEQAVADAEAALEKLDDVQKAYVDEQLGESASDRVAAARKSVNAAKDKARKEAEANKAPAVGTKLTIGDASYTVTAGQTVSYNGPVKKTMKTASVPDTVTIKGKSYKVTAIAANAFKNNKKLKKLTVGVNIEIIGAGAFSGCKAMKNMVIKTGVLNKVGKKAFYKTGSRKYGSLKIKVPKKMLKKYKKWFRSAKLSKKAKVKK